jgi:hypothetical protein
VLVLAGHEVSPGGGHLLVFGLDEEVPHVGRSEREICREVVRRGGVAFAAHPFSQGSRMSKRIAPPHAWGLLDEPACGGIELWALVTDSAEAWRTPWEAVAFLRDPARAVAGPPRRHLEIWDRLCLRRRVPAIGGLDAHQHGIRLRGRVRSPMPHVRYFGLLHTHVLLGAPPSGDLVGDRHAVFDALGEGRCYLSLEAVAPGAGFRFWAEGDGGGVPMGAEVQPGSWTLRALVPERARLRLLRDGVPVREVEGSRLEHAATTSGCYRLEARLAGDARERLWLASNPVYIRPARAAGG